MDSFLEYENNLLKSKPNIFIYSGENICLLEGLKILKILKLIDVNVF